MRYRYWELSCDSNRSSNCWETYGPEPRSETLIRTAVMAGWKIGPASAELDACPECRSMNAEPDEHSAY